MTAQHGSNAPRGDKGKGASTCRRQYPIDSPIERDAMLKTPILQLPQPLQNMISYDYNNNILIK